MNKPNVIKLIKSRIVRAKRIFRFSIKKAFMPKDGSLRFKLINDPPSWVVIDPDSGVISGMAPKVTRNRNYYITIQAENTDGAVTMGFFLKVVFGDIIDEYAERLMLILSLKKKNSFSDRHPRERELLDFLFEAGMHADDRADFIKTMKEHAQENDIEISEEPTLDEFKDVAHALHADIEKQLQKDLPEDHALSNCELTDAEITNLFRQGSQPLGAISRPVWNYMAAPNRHNWSSVITVLDSADEAMIKLRSENLDHFNFDHKNR